MGKISENNKAGSRNPAEPRLVGDILAEKLSSDEPFAVAYRNRFPNTELGVDLKLLTRLQGRLAVGGKLSGCIVRDEDMHYTFVEDASKEKVMTQQAVRHAGE